jgi:hypothetical protein
MIRLFLIIFFISATSMLYAQERSVETEFYNWFDEIIGRENTAIFNGVEYVEKHVMINEKHKFFLTSLFKPGTIYYEGQTFYNVNMKYNIFEDLIIVRLPRTAGGEDSFQLHSEKVQGFDIDGHKFLNITSENEKSGMTGIHEIIYETEEIKLLKNHVRKIFLKRDSSYPYHEFNNPGAGYAIYSNGEYNTLQNRRDILRFFPGYENIIKDYYKDQSKLQKSDPDNFYTGLAKIIGCRKKSVVQ